MKERSKERSISSVAALLMLVVFAVSILGALLGGAQVYQRLTQRNQESYNSRTCMQYLATKLRQAPGAVAVDQFGDGDALFLYEQIHDRAYVTRIYCHDGWLMELFTIDSDGFAPEDGEKILPLEGMAITADGSLITFRAQCGGEESSLTIYLRTGEVAS